MLLICAVPTPCTYLFSRQQHPLWQFWFSFLSSEQIRNNLTKANTTTLMKKLISNELIPWDFLKNLTDLLVLDSQSALVTRCELEGH